MKCEKKNESGKLIEGNGIDIKEYNSQGKLIFEGEYIKGKRSKGVYHILYSREFNYYILNNKIVDIIKIYNNINNINYFGEFKDGKRHGNGKEFDKKGNLLFIGNYINGQKHKGREYNDLGILIFKGEYNNETYYNGILNINDMLNRYCCRNIFMESFSDIIFEYKNGKIYKKYKKAKGFKIDSEYIDGNYFSGRIKKYNGDDLIIESEFKGGKIYNGFFSNNNFEGEYKNGKKI